MLLNTRKSAKKIGGLVAEQASGYNSAPDHEDDWTKAKHFVDALQAAKDIIQQSYQAQKPEEDSQEYKDLLKSLIMKINRSRAGGQRDIVDPVYNHLLPWWVAPLLLWWMTNTSLLKDDGLEDYFKPIIKK